MPEENTAVNTLQADLPPLETEEDWLSALENEPEDATTSAPETAAPDTPRTEESPEAKEPVIPDEPVETPERSRLGHRQKKVETELSELKRMHEAVLDELRTLKSQPAPTPAQQEEFVVPLPDRDDFGSDTDYLLAIADWRDAKKDFAVRRQEAAQLKYQTDFQNAYATMLGRNEVDKDLDSFIRSPDASHLFGGNMVYTGDPVKDIRYIVNAAENIMLKKRLAEKTVPLKGDSSPQAPSVTPTPPARSAAMPKMDSPIATRFAEQLRGEGWTEDEIAGALQG